MKILAVNHASPLPRLIDNFSELLAESVKEGASVGYLETSTAVEFQDFWRKEIEQVFQGSNRIYFCEDLGSIVAVVILTFESRPNSLHRAEVRKLLVRRDHRGKGIAKSLLQHVEEEARESGKQLLILDTESGSVADQMYAKLGWVTLGIIPRYAAKPDGQIADCTFYYKDL